MSQFDTRSAFSLGNFELVARCGAESDWQVQVARGLVGDSKAALEMLKNNPTIDQELEFFRGALLWISGDTLGALSTLKKCELSQAPNLAALINKSRLDILVQLHPEQRAIRTNRQFQLMVAGTNEDGIEIEPYASLNQQLNQTNINQTAPFNADLFLCTNIEQNNLPLDLDRLSFPTFAWTNLDSKFIQSIAPWLKAFDYLLVPSSEVHEQVQKYLGRPVFSLSPDFQRHQNGEQNFKRLLYLVCIFSVFPRITRQNLELESLAYKEPSFYKEAFGSQSTNCARRLYALARVKKSLEQKTDRRPVLDALRALILDYARVQYIPAIQSIGMTSSEPLAYRMIDELSTLGFQAFPHSLMLRFNSLRFFLHFGDGHDVQRSVRMIVEILGSDPNLWQVSKEDDALPFDFFPLYFNSERYLSLVKNSFLTGHDHSAELVKIIYSALYVYLGAYVNELPHLSRALELDPSSEVLRYRFAQALIRYGDSKQGMMVLKQLAQANGYIASISRDLIRRHNGEMSYDYSNEQADLDKIEFQFSRLMPLLPKVGVIPGGLAHAT